MAKNVSVMSHDMGEQFEELAFRVDALTKAHENLRETIGIHNEVFDKQGQLNFIFNKNFVDTYYILYGRNNLSAMAIEGEI